MPATRHVWLHAYHEPNPFARSLMRPLTIFSSEDVDVPWTPPGEEEPIILACSQHDFAFPYRNFRGEERVGRGRLWLPPHAERLERPRSVPLVLSIHYEGGLNWATGLLAEGWACMTPIALSEDHAGNLVGDGMDHTLAMAQLARRLEWVDLQRIGWIGGSAGGYQCLMALEALWPVACAVADVPVSDLTYDLNCLDRSNRYNRGITDPAAMVIPVVSFVQLIVERTREQLRDDPDEAWKHSVPLGASLIRSPTLIHSSTADLLCPIPQIGREFVRAPEWGTFPPGWTQDYEVLCNPNAFGKPLIEWIPREDVETISVAIPPDAPMVDVLPPPEDAPERPEKKPLTMPKPFSRSRLITFLIQDEGPPTPMCGHTKYMVAMDARPFFRHHFARGYVPPEHLTPVLLVRLLGRFSKDVPQNPTLPPIRRMYPEFDRWEVLLALETYMGTPPRRENVERLSRLYRELPPVARALDVRQDGLSASFADDPIAGVLFHQAVTLRQTGDLDAAEERERTLREEHAASAWAKLKVEEDVNTR